MPSVVRRAGCALIAGAVVVAIAAPPALAAPEGEAVAMQSLAGGAKRIKYEIGPFDIIPGQNEIGFQVIAETPKVDGWFTRIRPELTYLDGRVPGVDVIHLHHGVWLNLARRDATRPFLPERFFAAGEEKTHMRLPKGYGYPIKASDPLLLNHMIHNLTPVPRRVYMVYEVVFVPKGSRAARGIRPVRPVGWTWRTAAPTRSSTSGRARGRRAATPTRSTPPAHSGTASGPTSGSSTGPGCSWRPPGTSIRAAYTPT